MDKKSKTSPGNSIVVTGIGFEISSGAWDVITGKQTSILKEQLCHDCIPLEYLIRKKNLKLMSKQDRLAVSAAGKALMSSGIIGNLDKSASGIFISVGYIPFRAEDVDRICTYSEEEGVFSYKKFTTDAYEKINPLLTFNCLPNMPAYHIASNFNLLGEYFITYPGSGELYLALQEAVTRLIEGDLDWALVGGVADQNNFLVENHFNKFNPDREILAVDSSAFIVIENEEHARLREKAPLGRLLSLGTEYCSQVNSGIETIHSPELGSPDLLLSLATAMHVNKNIFEHETATKTHIYKSQWELL
jgi:hypothetical protein